MYDLLIIGGGPAGLSAAMTARNRNLTVCVICGGAADSALYKAGHVTNYPGVPDVSGPALLETMTQQARDLGADMLRERALSAMPMGKTFGVSAGKEFVEGRALLLATGIAQRGTFPGETAFLGRGVSYCATCDGMLYRGKRAAVIGLAADAPAEADFLREIGCDVQYYDGKKHRFEIRGAERADTLVIDGAAQPADVIFVLRAGFAADTLLPGIATEKGHIVVDESYAASIPGVFAAGDCTGAPYQIPARATARHFRSCAGSETLDKRRGRAYNFPIHLRRRGGVVSRRTSERRRLVRAFRMPEMKVAPEQPA